MTDNGIVTVARASEKASLGGRWRLANAARIMPKSSFGRNVATVGTATVVSQGFIVLASPLITRIYSPEAFGAFAVFTSLLSILTVPACWRYEQAIPLPEDDRDAASVLGLAIAALFVTVACVSLYLCFFTSAIATRTRIDSMQRHIWLLLPPSLLAAGVCQALSYWTIRMKAFGALGRAKLNQSIAQILSQMTLGYLLAGPSGLIVGSLFGRIGGAVSLARTTYASCWAPSPSSMTRCARRYRRFPFLSAPAALLSTLTQNLIPLVIVGLFGPITVGLIAIIQSLVSTPVNILSGVVGQVYLAESARIGHNRTKQTQLFWSVSKKMLLLGSVPLMVASFDSTPVIAFLFGPQWADAADYIPPLALLSFTALAATPLGSVLDVCERQDLHLFRETLRVGLIVIAGIVAAVCSLSPLATIRVLCASGVVGHLAYAYISLWAIRGLPVVNAPVHGSMGH